jgi:uncharacterized protein YegP (UPF0339 family)
MSKPSFQLFKNTNNTHYFFRLVGMDGETLLTRDQLPTRQSCLMAILAAKTHSTDPFRFKRKSTLSGYTFNLKGGHSELIGRSQNYATAEERDQAMRAVSRDAPIARIEDLTRQTVDPAR